MLSRFLHAKKKEADPSFHSAVPSLGGVVEWVAVSSLGFRDGLGLSLCII